MNNDSPLISIGIPTYNRAAGKLRDVVERSLEQTYPNIEVIVSDNCSTDNTPELMQSFTDPRLRYFRQETNIGPNNNFNYCLQQASGKYFLLFHDDDMIDPDFVESCVAALKPGQDVGVIITGVRLINEHDEILEAHQNNADTLNPAQFILGWYAGKTALYLCNTLYNTEYLKEAGGFHSKKHLFDDLVATFTLASKYGIAHVRDVRASFRRHSDNRGSSVPVEDWVEDSRYLLDLMRRLMPQDRKRLEKPGRQYFSRKMYRHALRDLQPWPRLLAYLRIYKAFDFSYSPINFLYGKRIRKMLLRH